MSALYEAWKCNTLTRSILRDYSTARLDSFFESRGFARDAVFLFSLLSSWLQVSVFVFCGCLAMYFFGPCFCSSASWQRYFGQFSQFAQWSHFLLLVRAARRTFPQFHLHRVLRVTLDCRGLHVVQHLWTLSRVFHSLHHLDLRARRRRGSFHWSLMDELQSWTLPASWLRYAALGSRVHPRGRFYVRNRLRSVVGRECLMAMAVVRRLRFFLCRASRAHNTSRCTGCVFNYSFNLWCFLPFFCHSPLATAESGARRFTHRSIGGLVRSATPIVLPIRGHLDSIKQLMLGDL